MSVLSENEIRHRILNEDLITNYVDLDTQLQPNGFDLTAGELYTYNEGGCVDFSNEHRHIPKLNPIGYWDHDDGDFWELEQGIYAVRFRETVKLPLDLMADSIHRSSLMRCGVATSAGRWDAGYEGQGWAFLNVLNPHGFILYKNARICQLKFYRIEGVKKGYSGQYQQEGVKKAES